MHALSLLLWSERNTRARLAQRTACEYGHVQGRDKWVGHGVCQVAPCCLTDEIVTITEPVSGRHAFIQEAGVSTISSPLYEYCTSVGGTQSRALGDELWRAHISMPKAYICIYSWCWPYSLSPFPHPCAHTCKNRLQVHGVDGRQDALKAQLKEVQEDIARSEAVLTQRKEAIAEGRTR